MTTSNTIVPHRMTKEGYKHTALGWIPEEWAMREIQVLIDDKSIIGHLDGNHGELYPSTDEFVSSGVPYISANNFFDGTVDFQSCKFLPEERAKQFKKGVAINGDVLFAHNATVGPVALLETNLEYVILSTTATYFRCDDNKLSRIFLLYALQSPLFVQQYQSLMGQSTRNQVPITTQRKLSLTIPPIPEQRKIAAILSTWDKAIAAKQTLITALQSHHRALMQRLLSGRVRLKGFTGEWKEVRLGEVFDFIKSYSVSREGLTHEARDESIYCIHYGDIHAFYENEFLDFSVQKRIPQLSGNTIVDEGDFLKEGDIIMADASEDYQGVGEAIEIINLEGKNAVGGLHTIVLRDKAEQTKCRFRAYLFSSENVRNQLRKLATGTSVYSIAKSTLQKVVLYLPPVEEQDSIAQILTTSEREIAAHKAHLTVLQAQKKGLMQVLLTGRLRVCPREINN